VGTFLIRYWRATGDGEARDLAVRAAHAVHRMRWQGSPVMCHGLAGHGDLLLDVAACTGDQRYRDMAVDLAEVMLARTVLRDGRMLLPGESLTTVHADYQTGLSGSLAFLLRLRDGGDRDWLPPLPARGGTDSQTLGAATAVPGPDAPRPAEPDPCERGEST
jgi:hypothetical protein